jgi:hypothetical protein
MANYADDLELDEARLERRLRFLNGRAAAHFAAENELGIACAATQLRDAGAISLILGDMSGARSYFVKAGKAFLSIGLPSGHLYLKMSAPAEFRELAALDEDLQEDLVRGFAPAGEKQAHGEEAPRTAQARARRRDRLAPRQLLSLYQAAGGAAAQSDSTRSMVSLLRKRLYSGAMQVSGTAIPLFAYLRDFDRLGNGDVEPITLESLRGIAIRRAELIDAARMDKYHWKMALRPTELIDFDLLAMGMAAVDGGEKSMAAVDRVFSNRSVVEILPFLLARDLTGRQGRSEV